MHKIHVKLIASLIKNQTYLFSGKVGNSVNNIINNVEPFI